MAFFYNEKIFPWVGVFLTEFFTDFENFLVTSSSIASSPREDLGSDYLWLWTQETWSKKWTARGAMGK